MSCGLKVLWLSTCLSVPAVTFAEELPAEELARIRRDEKEAMERVDAAHGNKKSSELSSDERRQIIEEQQAAIQEVMDQHGVSRKDYARQTARMGPWQNAQVDAAEKSLDAQREAPARDAAPPSPEEIPVQQGWGEQNPVLLEEKPDAPPMVERGLPTDPTVPAQGEPVPAEAP